MVSKFRLDNNKINTTKEAISHTLEIANNYAGELAIEVLPLNKIELDPENNRELALTLEDAINGIKKTDPEYDRKERDWKSLESLAKTIKDDQLINPIFVYRFGNKCRLIAGERRTLASAIAGKKEIIARIAGERPIGTKLKILQWIENNERADLSLIERIESIEAIFREYQKENNQGEKITAKLLGDLTGMSITQARRYILILQSKPEIRNAIKSGRIENIKLIEFLCSVKNEEHQSELLQAVIEGASFETVIKLKNEMENGLIRHKKFRGRKRENINFGSMKPRIAKLMIDALLFSNFIEKEVITKIQAIYNKLQWDDTNATEKNLKKIMQLIENGVL